MPDYLSQLESLSNKNMAAEIERSVKDAYRGPVETLINEGQKIRKQAYPRFFNALDEIGTGAADLSPEAALSSAIGASERSMDRYRNNLGLRDYYDATINDLVGKGTQAYQTKLGALQNLYGIQEDTRRYGESQAFEREKFNEDTRRFNEQMAFNQAQARRSGSGGSFGGFSFGAEPDPDDGTAGGNPNYEYVRTPEGGGPIFRHKRSGQFVDINKKVIPYEITSGWDADANPLPVESGFNRWVTDPNRPRFDVDFSRQGWDDLKTGLGDLVRTFYRGA